jgi:hypothetical protein
MTLQLKSPDTLWHSGNRAQQNVPGRPRRPEQAEIERLLDIKRGSVSRIGWRACAHLEDMLGALEIADDESAWRHCKSAVSNARAVAKLVNDLRETGGNGQ